MKDKVVEGDEHHTSVKTKKPKQHLAMLKYSN